MFGVFKKGALIFLSDDKSEATEQFSLQDGDQISEIEDLQHLQKSLQEMKDVNSDSLEDTALNSACEKLKDLGFTEENIESITSEIKEGGQQVIADVKSLGIKSVTALRERLKSFMADVNAVVEKPVPDCSSDKEDEPPSFSVSNSSDVTDKADEDKLPYSPNGERL